MIDLHTHSTFSDGTLTPEELVQKAVESELSALALTDHDTVAGLPRFMKACFERGITGVPGVEFSVDDELGNEGQLHILGLFIDYTSPLIMQYARKMKEKRLKRNERIIAILKQNNIEIDNKEVLKLSGVGVPGRVHIAGIMVKKGYVKSVQQAFDLYLGPGKKAFIPKPKFPPQTIIDLIHDLGGISILAHPVYLKLPSIKMLKNYVKNLIDLGLDGIEIFYSNTPKNITSALLQLCAEHDLLISGGSDFHGIEVRPDIRLGSGASNLYIPDILLEKMQTYLRKNR